MVWVWVRPGKVILEIRAALTTRDPRIGAAPWLNGTTLALQALACGGPGPSMEAPSGPRFHCIAHCRLSAWYFLRLLFFESAFLRKHTAGPHYGFLEGTSIDQDNPTRNRDTASPTGKSPINYLGLVNRNWTCGPRINLAHFLTVQFR